MKASNYNLFVHYGPDNVYIGFNSVSGAVLIFTQVQYEATQKIFHNPNQILDKQETELKNMLFESRLLVNKSVDEIKILKVRNNMARYNAFTLGLVIAPTLACNFDCPYCYVDRVKIKMSGEIIEKIKKFVLKKFDYITNLQVCWTGGEPLLAIDVVEELNNFFINEAQARQKKFSSSMVTNGYLLDQEHIDRLKKCKIFSLQVTLDGYQEYHDKFRYTHGGGKTYTQILKNVALATKNNINITLRSNLNLDNQDGIFKLIDDLEKQDINRNVLKFSPCKVVSKNGNSNLCKLFNTEEFSKIEPHIIEYALKTGINTNILDMGTAQTNCGANRFSTYVIDPYANLLKCWCNLGDRENNKIGYIKNDGNVEIDFPVFAEWMGWDPFEMKECLNCHVLPLCMGGCKFYNESTQANCEEIGCTHRKYNLEEMLKIYYLNLTKYNPQPVKSENENQSEK
jgi:uncharacterized protein